MFQHSEGWVTGSQPWLHVTWTRGSLKLLMLGPHPQRKRFNWSGCPLLSVVAFFPPL